MSRTCVHGYVEGKVQGVYYRQSTQEQAEALDVSGWVRNLEDGRVEVLMEGDTQAVAQLSRWLEQGPAEAMVTQVTLAQQPIQGIVGFVVRR